jgi:hypothetical protein
MLHREAGGLHTQSGIAPEPDHLSGVSQEMHPYHERRVGVRCLGSPYGVPRTYANSDMSRAAPEGMTPGAVPGRCGCMPVFVLSGPSGRFRLALRLASAVAWSGEQVSEDGRVARDDIDDLGAA